MRSVILATVLILISSFAYPGITSDSLYAEVDGNNVTLYDVGAERNCCAVYAMILTGEDHHIKWLQQSEGDICYCLCYFDLSVTTGPLEAGNYLVDVYYNDLPGEEDVFVGTIDFVIESARRLDTLAIIDFSQSTCYNWVSLPEKIYETRKLTCYPNPADLELNFEIECHSAAKLSVISLLGTEVWSSEVRGTGKKILSWNLENESGQRVTPGIYFYLLESGKEKITGKVMVK